MKTLLQSLLCVVALAGLSHAEPNLKTLTVQQVAQELHQKNVHVFDCNDVATYRDGHVPGAVRVDYTTYDPKVLPTNKDATLIFYCMNEH